LPDNSVYLTRQVRLKIENDFPLEIEEMNITGQSPNDIKHLAINIRKFHHKELIKAKDSCKYYLIPINSIACLANFPHQWEDNAQIKIYGDLKVEPRPKSDQEEKELTSVFSGFVFEKTSSQWEKAKELLEKMDVKDSNWKLYETSHKMYLIRDADKVNIDLLLSEEAICNDRINLFERPWMKNEAVDKRGTALLTPNKLDIYETCLPEAISLILEGVNVLVYNNPGKGLSTGYVDTENISASIEATYEYLHQVKLIPDEKILIKGQCFGAAPSAWLGKKYKKINLMLDQNPANFNDVTVNYLSHKLYPQDGKPVIGFKNRIFSNLATIIRTSKIVKWIVNLCFDRYDILKDIEDNEGHKLIHINAKDIHGNGGDNVVPLNHPLLMLDAVNTEDKELRLSINSGGTHITYWWKRKESLEATSDFFRKIGISQSFF
jgi:hypothetical protein